MDHIVQQLKKIGFNEYEAKSYVSLVKQGPVTAYQVSKNSGIPRARIYEILDNLVEKGIVMKEEINNTIRYSPLPVEIFLQKAQSEWQSTYEVISDSLKKLESSEEKSDNRVITLKDKKAIISYCQSLIKKAEKRIVISMWDDMYGGLKEELFEVADKVKVQGITLHVENPIKGLDIHRITPYTETLSTEHWFILSIDSKEMIYGPALEERNVAFYTDDPVHIYLLEDYVWHDVLVNRLVRSSQDNLEQWITTERKSFFMEK
ncbi:TPA: TrmB family transcriptional regulator [Bacillus toyonensis]|uniref:TrmB family transcriptional regulator n=1 Tax=Bacillus toyonensis TaxID=155322 RepID=UPI0005C28E6A|nr:TrmB family transcriptional regulator [Bacillus toyonensis]MDF9450220.1 helix-turn-helix domain-containing protein [Bacillus toyonensis]MDG1564135.1 helix-turn-helix domain-containing protein [Bacillus toyonensis]MED3541477.1 helix-turn-helix domain-containing protein [Bacillus toyonensis]MEE2021531.1 helix-turn-helix domain-containing protein [Bacillus toyonensis]QQN86713.1 TrmB family transcriptional regulator [Bacillus toyonensis]